MGSKILGSNKDFKLMGKEKFKIFFLEKSMLRFLIVFMLIVISKNVFKIKKSV